MGEWADSQLCSVEREGVVRRYGAPWTEKPQAVNPCEYTGGLAARAPRQVEPAPLDLRHLLEYAKRTHSTMRVLDGEETIVCAQSNIYLWPGEERGPEGNPTRRGQRPPVTASRLPANKA